MPVDVEGSSSELAGQGGVQLDSVLGEEGLGLDDGGVSDLGTTEPGRQGGRSLGDGSGEESKRELGKHCWLGRGNRGKMLKKRRRRSSPFIRNLRVGPCRPSAQSTEEQEATEIRSPLIVLR